MYIVMRSWRYLRSYSFHSVYSSSSGLNKRPRVSYSATTNLLIKSDLPHLFFFNIKILIHYQVPVYFNESFKCHNLYIKLTFVFNRMQILYVFITYYPLLEQWNECVSLILFSHFLVYLKLSYLLWPSITGDIIMHVKEIYYPIVFSSGEVTAWCSKFFSGMDFAFTGWWKTNMLYPFLF